MGKTTKNELPICQWLNGKTVVETAAEATHILISPAADAQVIEVGNRDRDNALSALTFAQDQYRLGRYSHELTDWVKDIHVYSSVDVSKDANGRYTTPYREDVGIVGPASPFATGEDWWIVDLVLRAGVLVLQPSRKLDPENHAEEKEAYLHSKHVTWEKIEKARKAEAERSRADRNRVMKHSWGAYLGYGFKIWIAHIRDRALLAYRIVTEPDTDKAWELRNGAIHDKIVNDRFVRPFVAGIPKDAPQTDSPDAPAGEPEAVLSILMHVAKGGKLTGETVDLMKLQPGAFVHLLVVEGSRLTNGNFTRMWNADDEALRNAFLQFSKKTAAGKPRYAVEL